MRSVDIARAQTGLQSFKTAIESCTSGHFTMTITDHVIPNLGSVSPHGKGSWPAPSDTKAEIEKYAAWGDYDSILVVANYHAPALGYYQPDLCRGAIYGTLPGQAAFDNGEVSSIYKGPALRPRAVTAAMRSAYDGAGGTASLGFPSTAALRLANGEYQECRVSDWDSWIMQEDGKTTAQVVNGRIWQHYKGLKGPNSYLGYPTSGEYDSNRAGTKFAVQNFVGGRVWLNWNDNTTGDARWSQLVEGAPDGVRDMDLRQVAEPPVPGLEFPSVPWP